MADGSSKLPALIAFGLVVVGMAIATAHGLVHGSVGGGVIAAAGVLPGLFGMWKGVQQETQGTLVVSVLAVLASLGAGAALVVLGIIHWAT